MITHKGQHLHCATCEIIRLKKEIEREEMRAFEEDMEFDSMLEGF